MIFCQHCEGELLRHGIAKYKDASTGVRYKCRECGVTFTQKTPADAIHGKLHFANTGRPTLKDWRYTAA